MEMYRLKPIRIRFRVHFKTVPGPFNRTSYSRYRVKSNRNRVNWVKKKKNVLREAI